jgi:RND family efflux transporter MFP subunit
MRFWILARRWTISGAASLLLVAFGCGHEAPTPDRVNEAPIAVETLQAVILEWPSGAELTGSVEPWARVSPGTKILGRIDSVRVREGERVARGALLAALERRDLEADVDTARAAVRMAEATLANAQAQEKRIAGLHGRGSATTKSFEDATAAARVAEAAVEQARARLVAAEVTLGYAEIRSPVDGWVVARMAEAGDMAAPGQPLFRLENLDRVKVVSRVPESRVVGLERGSPARVRIDVLQQAWDATVHRIVPAGDLASRTYEVQIVLDNPDGAILSGMFARVRFAHGTEPVVTVPPSALVRRGQLVGVFVVDAEERARLRWVRTGAESPGEIVVLSGLEAGERIVVAPPAELFDGAPVDTGAAS